MSAELLSGAVPSAEHVWGRVTMLSVAAVLLNLGLVFAIIPEHPLTAVVYTLALVACVIAVFFPGIRPISLANRRHTVGVLAAGIVAQVLLFFRLPPEYVLTPPFDIPGLPFYLGTILIGIFALAIIVRPVRRAFEPPFLATLVVFAAMGVWILVVSPEPPMDVHIFQKQGAEALLHGENPYSITTYPDLYGEGSGLYAPGLVEDGYLTFGFTYPPLSILMALPGHLLGDYRYVQLACMVLAALLVVMIRPNKVTTLAAMLMLLNPRALFILAAGWTDPYVLMLLGLVVLLAVRHSPVLPIALGLLVAIKQHLVLALPLALAALNGGLNLAGRWRIFALSVATAVIVSAPMILWNIDDFVRSAIALHLEQPFRPDSMSYLAWLGQGDEPWLPTWVGFALLLPTALATLWKLGRSTAAFVTTLAITYFVFFLFSKQAFIHYYYFVMGAVCIALAAWLERIPSGVDSMRRPITTSERCR